MLTYLLPYHEVIVVQFQYADADLSLSGLSMRDTFIIHGD